MGQTQRRKRKIREAMREDGKPLPSFRRAAEMAQGRRIIDAMQAAQIAIRAIREINAIKIARRSAMPEPAHTVMFDPSAPNGLKVCDLAGILRKANLANRNVIT